MYERYHHDVVGVNSRLDSIQAAVLNAKLPLLDQYGKPDKMQHVNILRLWGTKYCTEEGGARKTAQRQLVNLSR
jgi:hypothetical protein